MCTIFAVGCGSAGRSTVPGRSVLRNLTPAYRAGSTTCVTLIPGDCASVCWTHRCAGRKNHVRAARLMAVDYHEYDRLGKEACIHVMAPNPKPRHSMPFQKTKSAIAPRYAHGPYIL